MSNPFEKAAEIIHEKGWTQKNLADGGRVCLLGAVYTALGLSQEEMESYPIYPETEFLGQLLSQKYYDEPVLRDRPTNKVWEINDHQIKDADEAVHVLKEAAEAWEESHE